MLTNYQGTKKSYLKKYVCSVYEDALFSWDVIHVDK
jgi:hypothetical protein